MALPFPTGNEPKRGPAPIEKSDAPGSDRSIVVLRRDCEGYIGEAATPPALVKRANTEARKVLKMANDPVVAAKYLGNKSVVLTAATVSDKKALCANKGWLGPFGARATLWRPRYTVIAKAVNYGAPRLCQVGGRTAGDPRPESGLEGQGGDTGAKGSSRYMRVEVFHRECRVVRCYACHGDGHTARTCRAKVRCGYCAVVGHVDVDCKDKKDGVRPKCANYGGCARKREAVARANMAYNDRPSRFAEPAPLEGRTEPGEWQVVTRAGSKRAGSPVPSAPKPRGRPRKDGLGTGAGNGDIQKMITAPPGEQALRSTAGVDGEDEAMTC
ncbi:hypothetical protein ACJ73_00905 [Blastomyces percursus]|uniref:CCHC-type domain-containing protein n=1 Tax=Blastomyces percursus TaxID=1658174 RepID=A0A1J9QGU0_9EURO|nr:hypothetical protein ACJ73_00905 [Blastomyces percursus]